MYEMPINELVQQWLHPFLQVDIGRDILLVIISNMSYALRVNVVVSTTFTLTNFLYLAFTRCSNLLFMCHCQMPDVFESVRTLI